MLYHTLSAGEKKKQLLEMLAVKIRCFFEKDNYRFVAYFFFGMSIGGGLLVIDQYVHRATSSYHHCKSITRESIGDAEYIMSEQEIDVMDNCRGYDVSLSHERRGRRKYTARVVAPIRDSHGVYLAFDDRVYYNTRWKNSDEIEEADDDAQEKRDKLFYKWLRHYKADKKGERE